MAEITRDEWARWRNDRVTKEFVARVFQKREDIKEGIAESQAGNEKELYVSIGRAQGMKDIIDYAIFDFEFVDVEDKPKEETNA